MSADEPTEDDLTRRLVDSSVALRAGTLDADRRALLGHGHPQWQCEAAKLIAEGVCAYVMVEMVEPGPGPRQGGRRPPRGAHDRLRGLPRRPGARLTRH